MKCSHTFLQGSVHETRCIILISGDVRKNYYWNTENNIAPWCYTDVPVVRWEYCNPHKCGNEGRLVSPQWPHAPVEADSDITDTNQTSNQLGASVHGCAEGRGCMGQAQYQQLHFRSLLLNSWPHLGYSCMKYFIASVLCPSAAKILLLPISNY